MLEIESLIRRVEELGDEASRERTRALVQAVLELHGNALARIVEELRRTGGDALLRELARDEAVGCVLSLHGLYDVETAPVAASPPRPEERPGDFVPVERLRERRPETTPAEEHDRCDLCGAPLGDRHDHLVDPEARALRCACLPCASLFDRGGPGESGSDRRWKRVRPRADRLDGFRLDDDAWTALGIPIDLAFFFRSSRDHRVVAMYPSPAGATESLLSLDAWSTVESENPVVRALEADVEALLVRRGRAGLEPYRVSIDTCYALVGRIRVHWKGLGGGAEVWAQIGSFFDDLRRVTSPREVARA